MGPYELHDFFLYHAIRRGEAREKIQRLAEYTFAAVTTPVRRSRTGLDTFFRRFFSQQFKRSCIAGRAAHGNVSLSPRGDWRMPSERPCRTHGGK